MPAAVKAAAADAQVVLMRYGFEQLDRLNGYASGMPSPEFYQRLWEGREPGRADRRAGPPVPGPETDGLARRRDRRA